MPQRRTAGLKPFIFIPTTNYTAIDMNKAKFTKIIVGFLLLSNLLLIGYVYFRKPPIPEGPKKVIMERLQMDEQQRNAFEKLIEVHKKSIREAEDSIIYYKNRLYETLKTSADTTGKDSLLFALGYWQKKVETAHYNHFEAIRLLCKPEQYSKFDSLCEDMSRLFPQRGKKAPR